VSFEEEREDNRGVSKASSPELNANMIPQAVGIRKC
jgi:hypothetical protein